MIELRLWRSFVVLAEELNFRRAADRLHISQPALTKQIQDLENRLDLQLFRREPRGLEPTEATLACIDSVRALIDQAQGVEAGFAATREATDATLRVGVVEFLSRTSVPGILQSVRSRYPDARISFMEMPAFETAAAVADGRIDLGVARAPVVEQNVIARPYRRGYWLLVMPETHALAAKERLAISDIAGEPLIFFLRRLSPELFDTVVAQLESTGRKVDIIYQAQDPMIGVEIAASGIGLCLAASFALRTLPAGLVSRPVDGLNFEPMLDLVWRRDRMSPPLRFLIDAMTSEDVNADQ